MKNFEKHIEKNHSELAKDISDLVKHFGNICLIQLH